MTTASVPAGGQGSPPGVRGRPRRTDDAVAAALAAWRVSSRRCAPRSTTGEGAALSTTGEATAAATAGGALSCSSSDDGDADRDETPSAPIGTTPAGGQGSPPGMRGRPRRTDAGGALAAWCVSSRRSAPRSTTGEAASTGSTTGEATADSTTGEALSRSATTGDALSCSPSEDGDVDTSPSPTSTASPGGHGSPPGTRGSPRLSVRVAMATSSAPRGPRSPAGRS